MWYPVKGTSSTVLLLAWHHLCNDWGSACMSVCPCTYHFISLILGQLKADMLSCSSIKCPQCEEGPNFGNEMIFVVSHKTFIALMVTCHSRRLCHDLHSNATQVNFHQIHATFRPLRSITNDVVLFTPIMQHKGNTCCIKQVVISCLISGCTVGIFEPDDVHFSLGCHLVFAFTASVWRHVTQTISCWANVTFEGLCASVWLA